MIHDLIPGNFMHTFHARGRSERSMALDQVLRENACIGLHVVDILGEVGQQLALVLKKPDESMSWGKPLFGWEYILSNRIEDARIFTKEINIKDFLRIS
jgi:hypothetical protein